MANGQLHPVLQEAVERFEAPVYSPTGHILFERQVKGRGIWAIPFSLDRLEATGAPLLVAANASWPSVSVDGTLVHTEADSGASFEIVVADRTGLVQQSISEPSVAMTSARMSPDGSRIVASVRERGGRDLYAFDVVTGARTSLTFGVDVSTPQWAGANHVVFQSGIEGRESQAAVVSAAGGGTPHNLVAEAYDPAVTNDLRWLLYYRPSRASGADILGRRLDPNTLRPLAGEAEVAIVRGPSSERRPLPHPSGEFLAYVEQSDRSELYVTRFPSGDGKWQVASGGIDYAMWHPDGKALVYSRGDRIFEVPITLGATVSVGTPRLALDVTGTRLLLERTFDVTKDGKFVVARRPASANDVDTAITVVQNWLAEFRSTPSTRPN